MDIPRPNSDRVRMASVKLLLLLRDLEDEFEHYEVVTALMLVIMSGTHLLTQQGREDILATCKEAAEREYQAVFHKKGS